MTRPFSFWYLGMSAMSHEGSERSFEWLHRRRISCAGFRSGTELGVINLDDKNWLGVFRRGVKPCDWRDFKAEDVACS